MLFALDTVINLDDKWCIKIQRYTHASHISLSLYRGQQYVDWEVVSDPVGWIDTFFFGDLEKRIRRAVKKLKDTAVFQESVWQKQSTTDRKIAKKLQSIVKDLK